MFCRLIETKVFKKSNFLSTGDTIPPTINCPANVRSDVTCGTANTQVTFQSAFASDNAGTVNVNYQSGQVQFNTQQANLVTATFGIGVSTVTATATDGCGLTATCQFTVTVTGGNETDDRFAIS